MDRVRCPGPGRCISAAGGGRFLVLVRGCGRAGLAAGLQVRAPVVQRGVGLARTPGPEARIRGLRGAALFAGDCPSDRPAPRRSPIPVPGEGQRRTRTLLSRDGLGPSPFEWISLLMQDPGLGWLAQAPVVEGQHTAGEGDPLQRRRFSARSFDAALYRRTRRTNPMSGTRADLIQRQVTEQRRRHGMARRTGTGSMAEVDAAAARAALDEAGQPDDKQAPAHRPGDTYSNGTDAHPSPH